MQPPTPLPVVGGASGSASGRRRRTAAAAALSATLLLLALATATATSPSSTRWARASDTAAAGGKRLLQHLAPAAAEPAATTFPLAAGDGAAAAADGQQQQAAAGSAGASEDVEYMFDPVEGDEVAESEPAAEGAAAAEGGAAGAGAARKNTTESVGWRAAPWGSRMRELFPDVLADGHEALGLAPAHHGWSNKTGVADLKSWALREDGARLDDFFAFRTDRCPAARDPAAEARGVASGAAFTCAAARHPPTPFPGCHVFVNHAYRFIYIRSPKSASTSIVDVLGECGNERTAAHASPSCMKHSWEGAMSPAEIGRVWRDYFVFGFVRNPWKRAYSLYKYLHSDGCMQDGLTRGECGVSWDDFCEDPWGAADVLHRRDCLARSKSYTYFHMVDQWHCMRTAEGGSAVDFVGSVETGDEDWAAIVAAINARRRGAGDGDTAPPPPLPASRLGVSNVRKGQVAGPYNGAHSHCLDAVSRWYACDAEKFGYLPRMATDGPPDAL